MCALSVWLQFKNSKWIILRWSLYIHNIIFFHETPPLRHAAEIHPNNPLPFALNIVIKDPFFVSCNDILEKRVISLPWKKNCRNGYAILLVLTRRMRKPNVQLAHFYPIFFECRQIVDLDMLKLIANPWVLLRRLHSTKPL